MEPIADLSRIYNANHDFVAAAHQKLPQDVWDYVCGGAETETTLVAPAQSGTLEHGFSPRRPRDHFDGHFTLLSTD